jgi:hypothetical protein
MKINKLIELIIMEFRIRYKKSKKINDKCKFMLYEDDTKITLL